MTVKLRHIMLLALVAMLAACSSKETDEPHIPPTAVYDIVTLEETGTKGSVFTMRVDGDSPLITYTGPYDFNKVEHIIPGMRILICYNRTDGPTYTDGPITVYGYAAMSNTHQNAEIQPLDGRAPQMRPLEMTSIWRTGQFVNVRASVFVYRAQRPDSYDLIVDESTLGDPCPKLYLVYVNHDNNNGDNPYEINASFDMSEVWNLETCTGVEIYYNTPGGMQSTTFFK